MHPGETRDAYNILIRISEWKRSLGKPEYRLEKNTEVYLKHGLRVWTGFICLRI
jgi:hypothetical protein